ncbi:MAG TPA: HmuY family protein [Bacteroidales bacterium]|nr:HmuY family protein [Bacteroidales bacterium]HOK98906.1 HmuY family protein [Bacteroidales bacterium]HPO65104.1 HmuY family protein [Bacteroidales bacterium]
MRTKLFIPIIAIAFAVFSCKKDDEKNPLVAQNKIIDATSHTDWVYFSFEKDTIVNISEPENSLDWDIAFMRYMIKTNGGKNGKGQAGVAIADTVHTGDEGLNAILNVNDTVKFVTDDTVIVYGYNPANPAQPTITKYVLNPMLMDWYKREDTPNGTMIVSRKWIYYFRTAKGKYAKFYIKNYYNDEGKSGYFTIVYKYQADGSRSLE